MPISLMKGFTISYTLNSSLCNCAVYAAHSCLSRTSCAGQYQASTPVPDRGEMANSKPSQNFPPRDNKAGFYVIVENKS